MSSEQRPRAGIYCRASSDPRERGLSVETQEEDGRKWCAENGYDVAWVIVDNDYSASLWAPKDRPGYTKVQTNLAGANPVDALVARDASRLQRDLEVYVQVRALCARYGVKWVYNNRVYDLNRTDDRFTTGLDALLAERRASETRDDVLQAVRKRVRTGRPHGRVAYGYRSVYNEHTGAPIARELDPDQALIVKEIITRVVAGETIYSIVKDLDRRGIPAPEAVRRWRRGIQGPSEPWQHINVRTIAANPTYAGLRTHNKRVVGKGSWPAIVSEEMHYEAVAILADPKRRLVTRKGREARHLLSGIARCGVCGSAVGRINNRGRESYACKGFNLTWRGSRCVARGLVALDAYVTETILQRLERPDAAELFASKEEDQDVEVAREELAKLEARLEAFRQSAEDPDGISPATLARMEAKYLPLIEEARQRAVPRHVPEPVRDLAISANPRQVWEELSLEDRRQVVRSLVKITILKMNGRRGKKGFDPDGVRIEWVGEPVS